MVRFELEEVFVRVSLRFKAYYNFGEFRLYINVEGEIIGGFIGIQNYLLLYQPLKFYNAL